MKNKLTILTCKILVILSLFILSGCSIRPTRSYASASHLPAYRPPTLVPTPLPTLAPTPTVSSKDLATQTSCVDILRYIEDITIPDGTVILPGAPLDKRWRVENNGTCNWENGYTLNLVAGPDLGVPGQQALFPARSGSQAIIRILFKAPNEPGSYRSAWQAYNPEGQPFGDPIYLEIVVEDQAAQNPQDMEPQQQDAPEATVQP